MTLSLSYDQQLSRVRITADGLTVSDTFSRTAANGWGTSDSGHVWGTSGGSASDYSVDGSSGLITLPTVSTSRTAFTGAQIGDVDLTVRIRVTVLATGGYIAAGPVAYRNATGTDMYFLRCEFNPNQTITLNLFRVVGSSTSLGTATATVTHSTGTTYTARLQISGARIRCKFWQTSQGEPATWDIDVVDPSPLTTPGSVGCRAQLQSSNTNTSPSVQFDNFQAVPAVWVERSTDGVRWSSVRGGAALTPVNDSISLDDYEFAADVENRYRVAGQTASITPVLDGVWLKSLARPFLNRKVTVTDWSDVTRTSRSGVFQIVGRSKPVVVTDLHGPRQWTLEVATHDEADAANLDLLISTGEAQFVHVPAGSRIPGGYVALGDTSERRPQPRSQRRIFSLSLTECAPPGPDVVPAVGTWTTVMNTYATWADVLAAHATWGDLMQLVGSPDDVVVG